MADYFINPYTFIPIPDKAPAREDIANTKGDLTGFIECSMEIKSPTFIPNTTERFSTETEEHYKYDFYSYEDLSKKDFPTEPPKHPVIPGSEIRGMIRNVYEQLTNSCFPVVDENNWPYKRTNEIKKPYLLKYINNQWLLFSNPTVKKLEHSENTESMSTGTMVSVIEERTTKNGLHLCRIKPDDRGHYMLHKTGAMDKKRDTIVDINSGTDTRKIVSNEVLERFEKVINSYCKELYDVYEPYKKLYSSKKTLLVYSDITQTYLSPACMTKEFFVSTIDNVLMRNRVHNKCKGIESSCPACRLFGMIGETSSIASRVRFSDATEKSGDPLFDKVPRVLPILGTPKISATEYYLKRPNNNAKIWNYDYYTSYNKKNLPNGKVKTYIDRNKYIPELAGRKVYWHGEIKTGENIETKNQNMTCTVRALTRGTFGFKVYFENITEDELEKLIFCLRLNGEGIHKIGRGKPVGMGDNKIDITDVKTRKYSIANGKLTTSWNELKDKYKIYKLTPETNESKQILTYTKELSLEEKKLVSYPHTEESTDIFKWFVKNRGTVNYPEIMYTLPEIGSDKKLPLNPESNNLSGIGGGGSFQHRSGGGETSRFGNGSANSQPRNGSGGRPQNRGYGNGRQNTQSIDFDAAIKNMGKKNK